MIPNLLAEGNTDKVRGFEIANGFSKEDVILPARSTKYSAGYDFFAAEDCSIKPGEMGVVSTGVKAYMQDSEVLILVDRSSNSNRGIFLANSLGIVDADYYSNENNDGHVMFKFLAKEHVLIKKGAKIGQGIFLPYLVADSGNSTTTREGGFGSTGE